MYRVRVSTGPGRRDGLEDLSAPAMVCLLGEQGAALLHTASPLRTTPGPDDQVRCGPATHGTHVCSSQMGHVEAVALPRAL